MQLITERDLERVRARIGDDCVEVVQHFLRLDVVACRVWGSGFRVEISGVGFEVWGSGFGVWSSGFGVWGVGFYF